MLDDRTSYSRRTVLKAGSTIAIAGLLSPGAVVAQTDLPLEIEQTAKDEYVVIRNVGDEEVDITGYQINFEAGEGSNVDQIRELDGEVIIGPGEEILVPTGGLAVLNGDAFLKDPYETEVLNNEEPDVVALLTPSGETVTTTNEATQEPDDGDDGGNGDEEEGDQDSDNGTDGDEMDEDRGKEEDDVAAVDEKKDNDCPKR